MDEGIKIFVVSFISVLGEYYFLNCTLYLPYWRGLW